MDGIGSALTAQVRDRVDADEQLDVGTGLLVLAALEGDAALDRALLEEAADLQGPPAAETDSTHTPARRAYLGTISVQGFRGIGAGCDLSISPGPGLTLVVGRNGSGKSSFAEALELLLTGENRRWENRSAVWKAGWRNLHWTGPVVISATLAVEGARQPVTVRREWPQGSDLSAGADSVGGVLGDSARAALGWDEAITTYRPFLPYNELGSIPDRRPADLYDTMSAALGLDALVDARGRLRERRSERDKQVRTAESGRREWYAQVAALDDERARTCAQAIDRPSVRSWDLDAVELVLEGVIEPEGEGEIALLRGLATLAVPAADEVQSAAARLRTAATEARAAEQTDAGRARQIADLLQRSLALHAAHGDRPCPVCGSGELTTAWRSRTEAEVQRLRTDAEAAQRAGQALADARRAALALLSAPPSNLRRAAPPGVDVDALLRAWERWAKTPDAPDERLIDHLEAEHRNLAVAADTLREQAAAALERLEEAWRPLVATLRRWLPAAREAARAAGAVPHLSSAEKWLDSETDRIRAERFRPIAERAAQVWASLRQNSSVSLDRLTLEGAATRRHLVLDVSVDGTDGQALGVMSQGEIHALALSLFLPRVLLPESPFGFVVIDDPVQAMDPGKVDGLARVLATVAQERQVVVFTHDERLPESVRRLQIPAHVIEVVRRLGSQVACRAIRDPVTQYLSDARALLRTDDLPAGAAARAVPLFCRLAMEAACADAFRRRRIGRGEPHAGTDEMLNDARTLMPKLALVLFDDAGRTGEVLARINRADRGWADAVRWANRGAHGTADAAADLPPMVSATERLARWLSRRP